MRLRGYIDGDLTFQFPKVRTSVAHHTGQEEGSFRRSLLVLLCRGTGGQFAEEAKQCGRGFLIGEVFERYCGGEVRRGGVEADADKILVPPGGERIYYRAEFDGPVLFGGQYDRAGAGDGPSASAAQFF